MSISTKSFVEQTSCQIDGQRNEDNRKAVLATTIPLPDIPYYKFRYTAFSRRARVKTVLSIRNIGVWQLSSCLSHAEVYDSARCFFLFVQ